MLELLVSEKFFVPISIMYVEQNSMSHNMSG